MLKASQKDTRKASIGHAAGDLATQLALIDWLSDCVNLPADGNPCATAAAIDDRRELLEMLAHLQPAKTVNDAHVQVLMLAKHQITLDGIAGAVAEIRNRKPAPRYTCCGSTPDAHRLEIDDRCARVERELARALHNVSRLLFSLSAYFQANGSTVSAEFVSGYLPDRFNPATLERKALATARTKNGGKARKRVV